MFEPDNSPGIRPAASPGPWGGFAVHCTGAQIDALLHYGHFIPISHGLTRRYVDEHFPGWDWNELVAVLKAADVFVSGGGSPPQCRAGVKAIHFTDPEHWAVAW